MRLFIIRHAESANNYLARNLSYDDYMTDRLVDPPITELGERQADLLAQHLADGGHPEHYHENLTADSTGSYGFTHLYCSAMLRSLQTALPISQALDIQPEIWIPIHEHGGMFLGNPRTGVDLRIFAGLTRTEIVDKFPHFQLPDDITDNGWWKSGYEDMPGCYARATRVARELRRRAQSGFDNGTEESIALISHGTFIDSLLKAFFNQIPDPQLFYQHYNTAITRIDFVTDGTLFLRFLNRTQHLPADMISE